MFPWASGASSRSLALSRRQVELQRGSWVAPSAECGPQPGIPGCPVQAPPRDSLVLPSLSLPIRRQPIQAAPKVGLPRPLQLRPAPGGTFQGRATLFFTEVASVGFLRVGGVCVCPTRCPLSPFQESIPIFSCEFIRRAPGWRSALEGTAAPPSGSGDPRPLSGFRGRGLWAPGCRGDKRSDNTRAGGKTSPVRKVVRLPATGAF